MHCIHGRMGPQLLALWFKLVSESPHSSHITVSIRGQSSRLGPFKFGSSVPLQLVHFKLCSGHGKLPSLNVLCC
jgi:hypothetical protein